MKTTANTEKKRSVFDYINSVTYNKQYMWDELSEKEYVPYLVNRSMSYFVDTVLLANEVNINTQIDKKANYDYYFNIVRPRKRFAKWAKSINNNDVDLICKYFGFGPQKAKTALSILSEQQKQEIRSYFGVDNE